VVDGSAADLERAQIYDMIRNNRVFLSTARMYMLDHLALGVMSNPSDSMT